MTSYINEVPPAPSHIARAHFDALLAFETDCWDTHASLQAGVDDFILLDVRSPALYESGHIEGALNLPHGKMTERRMAEYPTGKTFVVCCAGPHCNGANKAACRLSALGLPVKLMIGGITGWIDEGFSLVTGKD
ncbi:rhodanese-like domain-containing protein [Thalassospira profundimaris]|uniref:rhodanese-like domain-containing protein n=1 Tax=Thalassospira profundimaris TaxID=502049 RepID=UPI0002872DAC|nr:rhodanese-like domain-containing protein [Thalassospira profundimaris]EKF06449.1 rhodanese-related sulfurtransferase [Thalassospira profundimaris WP0211]